MNRVTITFTAKDHYDAQVNAEQWGDVDAVSDYDDDTLTITYTFEDSAAAEAFYIGAEYELQHPEDFDEVRLSAVAAG